MQSRTATTNINIILKKALRTIEEDYDYIFIDSAPRNDILVVNSLIASDYILVPVRSEGFSLKGFKEVISKLSDLSEEYDMSAQFLGVFQVAAETNTKIFKDLDAEYKKMLGNKIFPVFGKILRSMNLSLFSIAA